jgi:hypothetical protein
MTVGQAVALAVLLLGAIALPAIALTRHPAAPEQCPPWLPHGAPPRCAP